MMVTGPSHEPILPGFYPDPSICRVGEDYFLVTSSFEYFPGVPIFHSRDLLHWEQLGHVLDRPSQLRLKGRATAPSSGVYAPTIRHHGGRFWMITTNLEEFDQGQLLVTATDPRGPWSEPIRFPDLVGIDPDLAWDDDGTCYLTYCAWGAEGISQAVVDPTTGAVLREPQTIWTGTGMSHPEGPHLYRHEGWWYLLIAEGGTHTGHSVSVARSVSPSGPFVSNPANPILSHRSTPHDVQATGHADFIQLPDGSWAAVHLGIRQRGGFPRFHVNGREAFLTGVGWRDGWPVIEPDRFDVPRAQTGFDDRGSGDRLVPRWISPAVDPATFARPTVAGIELAPSRGPGEPEGDRILATRVRDEFWIAIAEVVGDVSFAVRLDPEHWIAAERSGEEISVRMVVGPLDQVLARATAPAGAALALRAGPNNGDRRRMLGPDLISVGYSIDGEFTPLATVDGRYLSTEVAGGFTGRVLGLEALNHSAVIRHLRYEPLDS